MHRTPYKPDLRYWYTWHDGAGRSGLVNEMFPTIAAAYLHANNRLAAADYLQGDAACCEIFNVDSQCVGFVCRPVVNVDCEVM